MAKADTQAGARRWNCGICNYSFPAEGLSQAQARIERVHDLKPVTGEYRDGLEYIRALVHQVVMSNGGQAFNTHLVTFREQLAFYLTRTPETDRAAVAAEIEAGCCEPDEIADALPLTLDEVRLICDELVKTSTGPDGYEWRPIGRKLKHGARRLGIFRKDAPAHLRPIFNRPLPSDHYNIDRSGLAAAVGQIRVAARG